MDFDQTIADEICERLAKGESLRKICEAGRDDFIPCRTVVFKWLDNNEAFADQYARAREAQAEHFVGEIIEIADSPNITVNPETNEPEARDPQRDRLRVDARKWVASKLAPKKYGDATMVKHADADGEKIKPDEISTMTRLAALALTLANRADAPDDAG